MPDNAGDTLNCAQVILERPLSPFRILPATPALKRPWPLHGTLTRGTCYGQPTVYGQSTVGAPKPLEALHLNAGGFS